MEVCVMGVACNLSMAWDGNVQIAQTLTYAVYVTMETNITYDTDFTD